ncbi:DUF4124 domain-containing protein [Ectopseudomonas mendocina]|uniref:DUF4124 domain-containing protein n=1 Tax=Ectopseudomonas mendocina TaxID=300 RepID=A0ABZ2RHH2_ECTME
MRLLTVFMFCALALPASAQIYKYTDDRGNTVFTDQAPEGRQAETIELAPTNTVEAQPVVAPQPASEPVTQEAAYKVLRLTDIPTDDALRANNGTFSVGVEISPRLRSGHSLRLLLDGKPYGQPTNVPRVQLTNIDRGEHSLSVQVLSGQEIIQQSETRTFTVQRVHINSAPKPQPRPAS